MLRHGDNVFRVTITTCIAYYCTLRGLFTLTPSEPMLDSPGRDYETMTDMIFGQTPILGDALQSAAKLEQSLNTHPQ